MSVSLGGHFPYSLPSEPDVWRTTYDEQTQQKTYTRSPFGPGYAGHLPGTQNKFGHSVPGPDMLRMRGQQLTYDTKHLDAAAYEADLLNLAKRKASESPFYFQAARATRRAKMAEEQGLAASQASLPRQTADHRPMTAGSGRQAPTAAETDSKLSRCWSAPASGRPFEDSQRPMPRAAPPREARTAAEATRFHYVDHSKQASHFEDSRFSYFVPTELKWATKDRLAQANLSKLEKSHRVNLSMTGSGTGFWCEDLSVGAGSHTAQTLCSRQSKQWVTEHKENYARPPVLRTGCGPKPQRRALTVPMRPVAGVA